MEQAAEAQAAHFASLDPMLPPVVALPEGERLQATLPDGRTVHGSVYRAVHNTSDVESLWEPRTVWELTPLIGDTGAEGMRALLAAFHAWLRAHAGTAALEDPDSAARVIWPSRDVRCAPALAHARFVPMTTFAIRPADQRQTVTPASPDPDVQIRRATPADLPELIALEHAELRYSRDVTGATPRDNTDRLLAGPLKRAVLFGGRVLIAEASGIAVGVASCGWASPIPGSSIERLLPEGRWGYIGTLSVTPELRGRGVGAAMVQAAHEQLNTAQVLGTYLYYDLANPLSSVFWPRRGYRPLWTKWTARPVSALR